MRNVLVEHDESGVFVDQRLEGSEINLPVRLGKKIVVTNLGTNSRDHGFVGSKERLGVQDVLGVIGESGDGLRDAGE